MTDDAIYLKIKPEIDNIQMIDSHCHIVPYGKLHEKNDLFILFSLHGGENFLSSGMAYADFYKLMEFGYDLDKKWKIFYSYWKKIYNTGYVKLFLKALNILYGANEVSENNYADLSRKVTAAYSGEEGELWYGRVLQKAGIEKGILDIGASRVDGRFFYSAYRFENRRAPEYDHFITVRTRDQLESIEAYYDRDIHTFDDFLDLYEEAFAKRVGEGIVAVKLLIAYFRTLDIACVTRNEAEKVFNTLFTRYKPKPDFIQHQLEGPSWEDSKQLQDFMLHRTLQLASKHNLAVQIHAGFQLGNRNVISFADPKLLNQLFIRYKRVMFVIMHTAIPYSYDLACMARNFSNVMIDFSWANTLSPSMTIRFMSEMLEFLPAHKILGYGSDNAVVEGALGEAVFAREMVARVLAEKVRSGYFQLEEAVDLGEMILRRNAVDCFRLNV